MKKLLIGAVAGGLATAFVATVLVKDKTHAKVLDEINSTTIGSSQNIAIEHTEIGKLRRALNVIEADVSTIKKETASIRFQQMELKGGYEKLAVRISQLIHTIDSGSLIPSGQLADRDAETRETEDTSPDEEAYQTSRLVAMEGALYAQATDATWDSEAEGRLTESFQDIASEQSQLQGVTCQGVMCRVEIHHDSEDAMDALFAEEQNLIPWSHKKRMETITGDSGELTTVMYISREGHELPDDQF